jgi:putative tryptophan/tyrosine transport system substrate-binding protein
MKRRQFITLLGGAAAAWPLAARAQQPDRMRRVGLLLGIANSPVGQAYERAFEQELQRLGWTEGRNLTIEARWGEGRLERFGEIVAEFVRLKVDVIVTTGTPSTLLAQQATSAIPIVFANVGEPIGTGLVASLARPGGNVTGLSNENADAAGKRVELLREMVPGLRQLAILGNLDNTAVMLKTAEAERAAGKLGLDIIELGIRRGEEIAPSLATLGGQGLALYVATDTLMRTNAQRINTLALAARLPTMHESREQVEAGGLMSYAASISAQYQRAADFVDKILRGAKPADIPVEQPSRFELVINQTTAKALGLTVPQTLLVAADDVIE